MLRFLDLSVQIRILVGLAPLNSLAREVKKLNINEVETKSAEILIKIFLRYSLVSGVDTEDLRLKLNIVSFVCLGFILAVFFAGLSNINIVFLRLIDSLRGEDEILENFLLLLLLSAFLLLIFLLLVLAIAAILIALRNNIFLKKAPV